MNLEVVYWRDAHFARDDMEETNDYICRTVGWTKNSKRFVWVESERTPDGPRAITRIPVECIVRRQRVMIVGDGGTA